MRESVFIGTLGILFGAACGGSEAKADVTADVAATEVPDLSEDTAVEVSPEVEADTEVETGVDASGPEGWDRASAWLSVTVAGYANNAPRTVLAGALWATPEPETYALQEDTGSCRLSFARTSSATRRAMPGCARHPIRMTSARPIRRSCRRVTSSSRVLARVSR